MVVFDGFVESEPAELILNISDANRPPVLDLIGDKSVALGSTLSLQLTASDPDEDVITFGVSPLPLPIGARFDVNTGIFQYTPTPGSDADFSIIVSATDGVLTDSETIRIQLTNENASNVTSYSGQVLDSQSGEPVSGVVISAANQTATTDENGLFTLTSLPAGDILIWVFADENTQTSSDGLAYAGTTIAATLYENTANQATQPVRLSTVESGSPVNATGSTILASSTFGLTFEIPSGALENAMSGDPYMGDISISAISAEQANALPPNIVPCQLFSLQPKTVLVVAPVTLTVNNYDNLPAGSLVDVWIFSDGSFEKRGVGTVSDNASTVEASLRGFSGGELIALSPRPNSVVTATDQPSTTYIPSLLGEGNYATSLSLPGYTSNGASRGLSYVYNSTAAAPEPIAAATVTLGGALPESVSARIMIGGVDYGTDPSVSLTDASAGDTIRQAVQISADNLPTGVNEYEFISISEYACTKVGQVATGEIFVDNQTDSPFGQGWSLAELGRLYPQEDGTALIREGNGTLKSFTPQTDFSTLADPVRLPALGPFTGELVDIDRDGDDDIVWILPEEAGLAIYENLGEREFLSRGILKTGRAVDVPAIGRFVPDILQIGIGDFDGDGRQDIATVNQLSDQINVFFNDGDFNFSDEVRVDNLSAGALVAGDFDGNGRDDIVAFPIAASRPSFYNGSASRSFTEFRLNGNSARSLDATVGDYNNDGLPDIATRGRTGLALWKARPGQTPIRDINVTIDLIDVSGSAMDFADMDGDGQVELVVSSEESGIRILTINPETRVVASGAIARITDTPSSGGFFSIGDLNKDGLPDIVTTQNTLATGDLVTYFGRADGYISPPEIVPTIQGLQDPRLGDLDGDDSLDVVIDSTSADEVFVYFSDPTRTSKFIDPFMDYTELTRNEDGSYQRRFNDGTTISYDASGLQTSTTDSNGNVTAYAYDDQDRLILITDPVGLETSFIYGANGKLARINYPDGRSASWTYSASGKLIRHENVNGDVNTFGYDPKSRITTRTDPRGLTTDVLYGPAGRYAGSTLPDGTELKIELARTLGLPDLGGGTFTPGSATTTKVQDGRGNITETRVNDFGSPIEVTDPLGRITRYERDAENKVILIDAPSSVTADGRLITEIEYDEEGNVIAKREAVGTAFEREMT